MWALQFLVYALVVLLLLLPFVTAIIDFYFKKKLEYELKRLTVIGQALSTAGKEAGKKAEKETVTDEKP